MRLTNKYKVMIFLLVISGALLIMRGKVLMTERFSLGSIAEKLFKDKAADEAPPISVNEMLEEAIPVKVTTVSRMDYKDTIASFGMIKGFGEIPIKFEGSGTISKFYFKEGDKIGKDRLVVSQDRKAEDLRLEYAAIEYSKNEKLYSLGAITRDALRQSELEVRSSQLDLKKRDFYAPSGGIMGTREVNEGELVEPNDIVATFLDINKVFCEVGIIEKDMGKVKVGQKVKVTLDTFPDKTFEGTVDSVSPMIEGRSRTQTVRILMPNDEDIIRPGMFAKSEVTTFEKKDALVVPRKALKKTEDGYVVFGILRRDDITAKVIPVKIGRASEDFALILKGVAEGQEIVLESPRAKEAIKDGAKVEIIGEE